VAGGPIVPSRIAIPAIGVDTTVEHRGTVRQRNAFTGQQVEGYGVPTSMRTTSWWSDGPQPGSGQMAVVLGHTQVGGYGVFNELAKLRSGDAVTLRAANGDTLRLTVLGSPVTGLDKSTSALADTLNGHPPGADVALVTCGGQFDEKAKASEDNIVVFVTAVHG
jgi:sortase (surface protein transpeptidase)